MTNITQQIFINILSYVALGVVVWITNRFTISTKTDKLAEQIKEFVTLIKDQKKTINVLLFSVSGMVDCMTDCLKNGKNNGKLEKAEKLLQEEIFKVDETK